MRCQSECKSADTSLSFGDGAPEGWRTPYVIALLVVGAALLVSFIFWELRFQYPLVPMGIWRDRQFSLLIIILGLGYLAFPIASFFIALYLQRFWTSSSLKVAVYLLPMAISGTVVNVSP